MVQDLVNVTVTKGETAQLKCLAAGDAMPHMQFFKTVNGTQHNVRDLKGLENRTTTKVISTDIKTEFFKLYLWIHNVTKEDEGKYTCKAGNSIGKAEKDLYVHVVSAYPCK